MKFHYCIDCGWMSGPYPDTVVFAGPGGQIGCPVCRHKKQNKNIEVYGSVVSVEVAGWEPEIRRLQSLLSFYYEAPTVEDVYAYLMKQNRRRCYTPPPADVIRSRDLILGLIERIKSCRQKPL